MQDMLMQVIQWASLGHPAVVCPDGSGVYLLSMVPITDSQVNAINSAMKLEGWGVSPPKLDPLPDYGDLMSLEDWLETVKSGGFIDYDGHGYWATKDGMWCGMMQQFMVKPSDITQKGRQPPAFATHVMWFNR